MDLSCRCGPVMLRTAGTGTTGTGTVEREDRNGRGLWSTRQAAARAAWQIASQYAASVVCCGSGSAG